MSAQPGATFAPLPAHAFVTDREARKTKQHAQQLLHVKNRMLNWLSVPDKAARGILGIQGALNGREKFPALIAHKYLARQLHFTGKEENCDTFMCRVLTAISDAEDKCGRKFFNIKRADGVTLIITSYEADYIGEAALWALTEAKNSDEWRKHPAKAVTDELIAAACAKLPVCEAPANVAENGKPASTDDQIIQGIWTRVENLAESNLERIVKAGGDPVREVRRIQDRLMRLAISARKLMLQRDHDNRGRDVQERQEAQEGREGYGKNISDKISPFDVSPDAVNAPPIPPQTVGGCSSQVVDSQEVRESNFDECENSLLSTALEYAAQGVAVFPLFGVSDGVCDCRFGSECKSPGKHPLARLAPRGVKDSSTDAQTITRWFQAEPHANLGTAMGGELRLIALDSDPRNGGDASICDLVEAHGDAWLQTFTVKTGGLGNHFLFRLPEGVEVHRGKLAPGIDVKADGGYLVAPPSIHASGRRYEVEKNVYIADAPAWLLEELTRRPDQSPVASVIFQERRESTGNLGSRTFLEGERNNGLRDVSYGRWVNGYAVDETDLVQQLLVVNAERCVPPLEVSVVTEMARRCARKFTRGEQQHRGAA